MKKLSCLKLEIVNALSGIISMAIVVIFTSIHLQENNGIKLWGDEIGYWSNAALLTGRDWSGMASINAYYGFGYGFLLAPIMNYAKSPEGMMHMAVILQILLLCSCIIPSRYLTKKLVPDMNPILQTIISLASVLYSSNVFMVNVTIAEILLVTCLWWDLFAWMRYIQSGNKIALLFFLIIPLFMYTVHQRTIVHLLIAFGCVCGLLLIDYWDRKYCKKNVIVAILSGIMIVVGFILAKEYERMYTEELYSYANQSQLDVNSVTVRTEGVLQLFVSVQGLLTVIKSLCGKMFYAISATYGLVLLGVFSGIDALYSVLVKKSKKENDIYRVFVFLTFCGAMAVATMAMISDYDTRNDRLMYGRYSEYAYGPLIIIGLTNVYYKLYDKIKPKKEVVVGLLITLILGVVCVNLTSNTAPNNVFWMSCPALGDLLAKVSTDGITNKEIILIATIRCVLLVLVLYVVTQINSRQKTLFVGVWILLVIALWLNTANTNWEENVMSWYGKYEECSKDIVKGLENESDFGTLDANMAGCFQFELYDSYMHSYNTIDEIYVEGEYMYIITDASSEYVDEIQEKYEIVRENDKYILWVYR